MSAEISSLTFRRPRIQTAGFVLGAAVFVVMGWAMTQSDELFHRAVGWVCIAFFGAVVVSAGRHLFKSETSFTLDSSGIVDRSRRITIAWSEIEKVTVFSVKGNRFLGLVFRDPQHFLSRLAWWRRPFAHLNERMGWCYWSFSFNGVTPGIDEAIDFIGDGKWFNLRAGPYGNPQSPQQRKKDPSATDHS